MSSPPSQPAGTAPAPPSQEAPPPPRVTARPPQATTAPMPPVPADSSAAPLGEGARNRYGKVYFYIGHSVNAVGRRKREEELKKQIAKRKSKKNLEEGEKDDEDDGLLGDVNSVQGSKECGEEGIVGKGDSSIVPSEIVEIGRLEDVDQELLNYTMPLNHRMRRIMKMGNGDNLSKSKSKEGEKDDEDDGLHGHINSVQGGKEGGEEGTVGEGDPSMPSEIGEMGWLEDVDQELLIDTEPLSRRMRRIIKMRDGGENLTRKDEEVKVTSQNGPHRSPELELDEIKKYFDIPVAEAAKKLNVGLTMLKRRCRQFNIMRWPHRKIKSLRSLINYCKEKGMTSDVEMLEEHLKMLEKVPDLEFTDRIERLLNAYFKANYKRKRYAKEDFCHCESQ